ncbi:MAG: hypothetical protein LBR73_05980 [Oscillospiraceae bacterium]|jgi:hypothetical protein|nr:hypothetical protein [Oscillospiraceae bacterium]
MIPITEQSLFIRQNTGEGHISYLPELYQGEDRKAIFVKSGHGLAATVFLRTLSEKLKAGDEPVQIYYDAPGKERICGLWIPGKKTAVLQADPPYAAEAKLPVAAEHTFALDTCFDREQLQNRREELESLHTALTAGQNRVTRFLRAGRAMKRDVRFVAEDTLDRAKVERYASKFASKRLGGPSGKIGREYHAFLTAITGQGLLLRRSSITAACTDIVILDDEYGTTAPLLWNQIRAYALGNGLDVISCPCPLAPKEGPEHLIIPEASVACITANKRHPIEIEGAEKVLSSRFFDKDAMREHRCRINFCRRTMRELLSEAYTAQETADAARKAIDDIYQEALDETAAEALAENAFALLS